MARKAPVVTSKKSPAHTVCSKGEIAQSTVQDVRLPSPGVSGKRERCDASGDLGEKGKHYCTSGYLQAGSSSPNTRNRSAPTSIATSSTSHSHRLALLDPRGSGLGARALSSRWRRHVWLSRARFRRSVRSARRSGGARVPPSLASAGRVRAAATASRARLGHARARGSVSAGWEPPRRARGGVWLRAITRVPGPGDDETDPEGDADGGEVRRGRDGQPLADNQIQLPRGIEDAHGGAQFHVR